MTTSHQLARELLLGPDLPVCIADPHATGMHNLLHEPKIHPFSGSDGEGGEFVEADRNLCRQAHNGVNERDLPHEK